MGSVEERIEKASKVKDTIRKSRKSTNLGPKRATETEPSTREHSWD